MTATNTNVEGKKKFSPKRIASKIGRSFKDLRGEVKKVVWPTKKQVVNNTIVVLVTMLAVGIVIWLLDFGMSTLVSAFLQQAS
ncbi:preprotein translocase subunit SecE [Candidatus Soleaferrea massiliensis]|uniref:preprotein translocase subunit SecE n=1 Tax=Candidatus Soleaferrea massiliensis TaxID=1470354 RepID=UPI00058E7695|nr:preprotein translocase subunit SecE [Candidatus Soleaferrea massiliensis]